MPSCTYMYTRQILLGLDSARHSPQRAASATCLPVIVNKSCQRNSTVAIYCDLSFVNNVLLVLTGPQLPA